MNPVTTLSHSRRSTRAASHERGGLLVLTAMLITVLVIFAAIAIDTSRLAASHNELRQTAETMALGILEGYLNSTSGQPLDDGARRGEELGGFKSLVADRSQSVAGSGELAYRFWNDTTTHGEVGTFTPGKWWFQPPTNCASYTGVDTQCPCIGGATGTPVTSPCFEENADATVPATAIKLDLYNRASSPLKTIFKAFLGGYGIADDFQISTTVIATRVPRYMEFLVDLSKSTSAQTHHEDAFAFPTDAAFYASALDTANSTATCGANGSAICAGAGNTECRFVDWAHDVLFNQCDPTNAFCLPSPTILYSSPPPAVRPSASQRYESDYACYNVNYTEPGYGNRNETYVIDTRYWSDGSGGSAKYDGPEPLTTILRGIRVAVQRFQNRSVMGDLIGAIGFDRSTGISQRIFPLSRPDGIDNPGNDDYDLAELGDVDITGVPLNDPTELQRRLKRIVNHMFFPRSGMGEGMTNLPGALSAAIQQLQNQPLFGIADSSVVIFSDGLTTCTSGVCGSDFNSHLSSWNSIVNPNTGVLRSYANRQVAIHFFLMGGEVMPHTLLTKSAADPTKCMEEDEARGGGAGGLTWPWPNNWTWSSNTDYEKSWMNFNGTNAFSAATGAAAIADLDAAFSARSTTPYPGANWMYELSRRTRGVWAPIRPCCKNSSGSCDSALLPNSTKTATQALLDASCNFTTPITATTKTFPYDSTNFFNQFWRSRFQAYPGGYGIPNQNGTYCWSLDYCYDRRLPKFVNPLRSGPNAVPVTTVDSFGRVLCDPRGLDEDQQVQSYIDQILETNPFLLVQ